MPAKVKDFRAHAFDVKNVRASGKDVGARVYPQLYTIENLMRVVVHSVLTAQLGSSWWNIAAEPDLKKAVDKRKKQYAAKPWHGTPGKHEVYFVYLSELTKILTTHSDQFTPHIPDVGAWTARLEQVRVPRNIVGHMNWPTPTDRSRIEVCLTDVEHLVAQLATSSVLSLKIP